MKASTTPTGIVQQRLAPGTLLLLVAGNLLVAMVAVVWLWIPDSHTWQLLASGLLALALLSGFLLCNAAVLRRVRTLQPAIPLWAGALVLGGWLVLAALLFHAIGRATSEVDTRAGYWNSQMSHSVRALLPYTRLITLQNFAIGTAQWVLLPATLMPFLVETTTFGAKALSFRRALRAGTAWVHWAVALPVLFLAFWLVPRIAAWHPAHTVTGETISAALRLTIAAMLTLLAGLTVVITDAELLHRSASRDTSEPE